MNIVTSDVVPVKCISTCLLIFFFFLEKKIENKYMSEQGTAVSTKRGCNSGSDT